MKEEEEEAEKADKVEEAEAEGKAVSIPVILSSHATRQLHTIFWDARERSKSFPVNTRSTPASSPALR